MAGASGRRLKRLLAHKRATLLIGGGYGDLPWLEVRVRQGF